MSTESEEDEPTGMVVPGIYNVIDGKLLRYDLGLRGLLQQCIAERSLHPAFSRARAATIQALVGKRFVLMNARLQDGAVRNRYGADEGIVQGNVSWDTSVVVQLGVAPAVEGGAVA